MDNEPQEVHKNTAKKPQDPASAANLPVKNKNRNPNYMANLKQHSWKPGQSGNPDGAAITKPLIEPEEIKQAVFRVFKLVYGDGVINSSRLIQVAKKHPIPFMRLCAQLIPKDIEIRGDAGSMETRILIVHQTAAGEQPVGQTITVAGTEVSQPIVPDASTAAPISQAASEPVIISDSSSASNGENESDKRT